MPTTNPTWIPSSSIDRAFALARQMHGGQSRKTEKKPGETVAPPGVPYLGHLLIVAGLVIDHGGTETQAMAALLHDAIEDTYLTRDALAREMGDDVADIVDACSDADDPVAKEAEKKLPVHEREALWWERKRAYLDKLASKNAEDPSVLVALADKVHNSEMTVAELRQLDDDGRRQFWARFNVCRWYQNAWYTGLVGAFEENKSFAPPTRPLVRRLAAAVHEMQTLSPPPEEHPPH